MGNHGGVITIKHFEVRVANKGQFVCTYSTVNPKKSPNEGNFQDVHVSIDKQSLETLWMNWRIKFGSIDCPDLTKLET